MAAEGVDDAKLEEPDMSITGEITRWADGEYLAKKVWRQGRNENEGRAMTRYTGKDLKQNGVLDVERLLGQGGMGCVWLARDKADGTAVAIKVAKEGSDLTGIRSQLREILVRDRLRGEHKNLARALGFDDSTPGIPMFFVAYDFDMYYAVVEANLLSNAECICLTQEVASGLSYLHQNRIVHGDIKLENILLELDEYGNFTAKITDLGGAMGIGDDRRGGGTDGYIAPEAIFGMCLADPNQDSWALGHMLLVMFTKPECRASNMFMLNRNLTDGDRELKARMEFYGNKHFATRYITHKNMLAGSTLPTLLGMLQDELAYQLQLLQLIHLLLRITPTKRISMLEAHDKLDLLKDDLERAMPTGSSEPARLPDSPAPAPEPEPEPLPAPPQREPQICTRTEAPAAPPPGLPSRPASNGERYLPSPPPPPALPPGLDLLVTRAESFQSYLPLPPVEGAALPAAVSASAGIADADNEAHSPTSTVNGDEMESCLPKAYNKPAPHIPASSTSEDGREVQRRARDVQASAGCGFDGGSDGGDGRGVPARIADAYTEASSSTSTVNGDKTESYPPEATTKSMQIPSSDNTATSEDVELRREISRRALQVQSPGRCGGGGSGGPTTVTKVAPASRAPQGFRRLQRFGGRSKKKAAANPRLATSMLGAGVQSSTPTHGVAPHSSHAKFCGAHERVTHGMGYPYGFGAGYPYGMGYPYGFGAGAGQRVGEPNPAGCHGAPPSAAGGSGSRVTAAVANYAPGGFTPQGYWLGGRAPLPCFSPPTALGWADQGGEYGGWTGHPAVGCGAAWQGGPAFPYRHHAGGIHGHPRQGKKAAGERRPSPRSGGSTTHAGRTPKGKPWKRSNRRGGRKHPRAVHPEHAGGGGGVQTLHATDLVVPHAMAVNGPAMCRGSRGLSPQAVEWIPCDPGICPRPQDGVVTAQELCAP